MTNLVVRVTVNGLAQPAVLVGRAALIVAFLVAEADHLNKAPRGSVEFNFDGAQLKPSIHEHYPHCTTDPSAR